MDGTWAPIERGVTATSSKCPVFKETEGELSLSQMFQMLCQPVIIPATSLPPHCLHLCIQHTDSLFPPLLRTLCPCLPPLTLSHTHTLSRTPTILLVPSLPNARRGLSESVCVCTLPAADEEIHLCMQGLCFDLTVCTFLRGCRVTVISA